MIDFTRSKKYGSSNPKTSREACAATVTFISSVTVGSAPPLHCFSATNTRHPACTMSCFDGARQAYCRILLARYFRHASGKGTASTAFLRSFVNQEKIMGYQL